MVATSQDPLIGTILGKDYRVLQEIGRGGMAVVYLVEHQTLRKQFAAKVLSTELTANDEARARFNQEAHAASQLDHENIVNISDFGATADGRPFFVMELLRGQALDRRIVAGGMTIEEFVAIAIPVARALGFAHAEGIVHRDVKPENIFLVQRTQGRWGVKVLDFGIAKAPLNDKLTKMGQTLGSPMFMSPEACRGDDVDHRADLYSLGVVLFLMLCGRVPFEDESVLRVLQMQVTQPLPPPRSINPNLSRELAAVLERLLAKAPGDRYQSASELIDAIEAAIPTGADRLLIEAQRGSLDRMRSTPFPGVAAGSPGGGTPAPPDAIPAISAVGRSKPATQPQPLGSAQPRAGSQAALRSPSSAALPGRPRSASPTQPQAPAQAQAPVAPPAEPRSRTPMIILAGLALVFAAFGILFAVKRLGGTGSTDGSGGAAPIANGSGTATEPAAVAAVDKPAVDKPAVDKPADTQPADPKPVDTKPVDTKPVDTKPAVVAKPAIPDPPAAPAKIKIAVSSRPPGGLVFLDGARLGITPLSTELPRSDHRSVITISRDGYTDATRKIDLRADVDVDLQLTAVRAKPATTNPNTTTTKVVKRPDKPVDHPPGDKKNDPGLDIRMSR